MPDDRFEDRLRALAQQLSRSISDVDLDDVADRLGVDRDRVQGAADAARDWLTDRSSHDEPLFGDGRAGAGSDPAGFETNTAPLGAPSRPAGGPHPLDMPTDPQGRALSALDSGRWTVRPGSGRLTGADDRPGDAPGPDIDLVGELHARDWIGADGALTLVGRQALLRWSAAGAGSDTGGESTGAP